MLEGVRQEGLGVLPWTPEARSLRARVAFLRRVEGEAWPDLSDDALAATLQDWLLPWIDGMTRSEEHTYELQSLMRISYAVFCLKKKNKIKDYETKTKPTILQENKH